MPRHFSGNWRPAFMRPFRSPSMRYGFEAMSETTQRAASADPILDLDVAVIGAGIAGCYTAWRLRSLDKQELTPDSPLRPLLESKDRLDVALFEYSDRVGGRVWSAAVNGIPEDVAGVCGRLFD